MIDNYAVPALWEDKAGSWHDVMPGVKRRISTHSQTGMIVFYKIQPGVEFPRHNHPHAQFGLIIEGQGTFNVGDRVWKLKAGDGYYIPPGVYHELKTSGDKTFLAVDFFTPERTDMLSEALSADA